MAKYGNFINLALSMISRRGTSVPVKRFVPGAFDPVTQSGVGAYADPVTFRAVFFPPAQQNKYAPQTLLVEASYEVYFALKGQASPPRQGDLVTIAGADLTLTWAQTYDVALDGPIFTMALAK